MSAIEIGMLSALQQGYREPRIGEIHTTVLPNPLRDLPCNGSRYLYADYPAMAGLHSSAIRSEAETFLYPTSSTPVTGFSGADRVKHSNGVFIAGFIRRDSSDSSNFRRSTDMGLTFSLMGSTAIFGVTNVSVHDFDASSDGKWMFVGAGARLAYSADNGATFAQIRGNLPGSPTELFHVAAGPVAGQWIVSGRTASSSMFTTWFTDNNGASWSQPLSLPTVSGRTFIGHRGTSFLWDSNNTRWLAFFVDNGLRVVYSSGGVNPSSWTELISPTTTFSASAISSSNTSSNLNAQPFLFANRLFLLSRDDDGYVRSTQITNSTLNTIYTTSNMTNSVYLSLGSGSSDLGLLGQNPTAPAVFVNPPFVVGRMYFFDNCGNGSSTPPLKVAVDLIQDASPPYSTLSWLNSSSINFQRPSASQSPGVLVGTQYFRFGGNSRAIWDLSRLTTEFQTPDLRADTPYNVNGSINIQSRFGNYLRAK